MQKRLIKFVLSFNGFSFFTSKLNLKLIKLEERYIITTIKGVKHNFITIKAILKQL